MTGYREFDGPIKSVRHLGTMINGRAHGVDVSHFQDVRSWSDVYDSGISFVGVKATQGNSFTDPKLSEHRAGARSMPFVLRFYYHFASPGDPIAQANRFMDTVGPLLPNERLCLDLEDDKTGKPAVDLRFADAFYTTLLGSACSDRRPWFYTSDRIWQQLGNPAWDLATELDLIAPRYGVIEPVVPGPWKSVGYTAWQYSESLVVPGVRGPCDASYFKGSDDDLKAYAALTPAPLVA